MKITEENKLKGSLFIEAYGSLIDGISKDAETETEKALDITFNAIGAASATVMFVMDPLGSIIGAGIGWLIEHVSFLRDALNQLMGNPEEIQANVEANKARAAELRVLAEDHKNGLATFDGWSGVSSERFKASMDGMSQELDDLANAVESKAKIVAIMGMLVTVLRDIVRDLIAQLLGSLIGGALLAAAAMIPTFGASIPAFIGFAVGKAVALGTNIASRVARVIAALGRQMKRIGDLDDIMKKVSKGWERFENSADVAEISYEGYKASKDVDKKIDEAVKNNQSGGGGGDASGGKPSQGDAALANARVGTVQAGMPTPGDAQLTNRVGTVQAGMPSPGEEAIASARVGTVQGSMPEGFQAAAGARVMASEPLQASERIAMTPAEPMQQALRPTQMSAAEPLQPAYRAEAAEPVQGTRPTHMTAAEPLQPAYRVEAAEPVQGRMAYGTTDSTMASGVSMTAGTPVHEALQPMQAREAYVQGTPAEPLQQATLAQEPIARTQMSQTFEALEPTQAREAYVQGTPVQQGVNPLVAGEPLRHASAFEADTQAGGAASAPLRPTVSGEKPTRQSE
ncbi:hypothetical protein ACIA8G_02775 [Lentzea sp. NPDC051213]|uniref:hypothetical protein n=1 Tax=Lentzea sp. NPDC051213 TaxID=3364126 RepID=UPI0037904BF7